MVSKAKTREKSVDALDIAILYIFAGSIDKTAC